MFFALLLCKPEHIIRMFLEYNLIRAHALNARTNARLLYLYND